MSSRSGDLDTSQGQAAQRILDNTQQWTEKCYDWSDAKINEYIDKKGKNCNRILYIEYQYYQIGLSQEWLKKTAAGIGDPLTVRREILLQRLHGSSLSPYPQEDLEYIAETQHKPIKELWINDYFRFDVYEELDRRIPYLVGVDCSTGTVGDNNAITVLNPFTLRPAAEFECNYIGETLYIAIISELVEKHLPRACICIERNSIGDAIIDFIINTNNPLAANLYYDKDKNLLEERLKEVQDNLSLLQARARSKTYYGVYTSGQSRESMFAILAKRVSENKDDFITKNIIRDLSRLVRRPSGKIEAANSFHDDSIMSYLIALYVYYHGDNLAMFGITRGARDEDLDNSGLKRPEEIDPSLVDPALIAAAKKREQQEADMFKFEQDMLKAEMESQRRTRELHNAGLIHGDIYDHTPEDLIDEYDSVGEVDLSIF